MQRLILHAAVAFLTFVVGLCLSFVCNLHSPPVASSDSALPIVSVSLEVPPQGQDSIDRRCELVREMFRTGVFSRIVTEDERRKCKEWEEAKGLRSYISR